MSGRNLSRELSRQYRQIPQFLQWEHRSENKESLIGYRLVQDLYLEFLYNDFLLHRILAKRIQTQSERGIAISLEILTALISIISWTHQNHAMGWDASWNVSLFPLLRQQEHGVELINSTHSFATLVYPPLVFSVRNCFAGLGIQRLKSMISHALTLSKN